MNLKDIVKSTLNSKTATDFELQTKTEFVEKCMIEALKSGYKLFDVYVALSSNNESDICEQCLARTSEEAEEKVLNNLDSRVSDKVLSYWSNEV